MNQQLAITIDGTDGVIPDSVGTILKSVFALLDSLDSRSWNVGAPRIRWQVTEARLINPLTLTATGKELHVYPESPNIAMLMIEQLREIGEGRQPKKLTRDEIKYALAIGKEARRSRALVLKGSIGGREDSIHVGRNFAQNARKLLKKPKTIRSDYGSVDGTLIGLLNDPLRDDAKLTIRERVTNLEIACSSEPHTASRMAQYVNRQTRVILYGTITYEDDVAVRINVEDFKALPQTLPTLDDLHALNLRVPGGIAVEDYLDEMRGEDE